MRRHPSPLTHLVRDNLGSLLVLAFFALTLALLPSVARSTVSWRGDFETGNFSQWNLGVQQKDPTRVTISSSVVRQGRYAARFEVRSGDNNVAGSGTGERAEVLASTATTEGSEGRESYWAWSTYFPSDFAAPGGAWNVFTQFHNSGTTGQANIHFDVRDMQTIGLRVMGGDFAAPTRKDFILASLQRGRWYDFVFHVKWSSSASTGFVEVWLNGSRVVSKTFTPTLYAGQGAYVKQGYYRAAYSGTTVIYHDGMRKGSSYDEVAAEFPSGGSTLQSSSVTQSIANGSTLSGTTGWAATPSGMTVSKVDFTVDGTVVASDASAPYSTSLDTSSLANGSHFFAVKATATDGKTASSSATATVNNQTGTLTVAQSVANGQTVSGSLPWSATTSGKTVSKVEFTVNGALVATEYNAPYEITLDTTRFANGTYPFAVKAFASDGTTAGASATVTVSNAAPATFSLQQNVSDGQTVAGTLDWIAEPKGKAVKRVVYTVDGAKVATEQHAPYRISYDTRKLGDGKHAFATKAYAADGATTTASATVTVANQSPAPSPLVTFSVSQSVASGQTLTGSVKWTAAPSGKTVDRIEFSIDGRLSWTERYSPYVYAGDAGALDTRSLADGSHTLSVKAFATDGAAATASAAVSISNGSSSGSTTTSSTSSGATAPTTSTTTSTTVSTTTSTTTSSSSSTTGWTLTSSIRDGSTITGSVSWTIDPSGKQVSRMEFLIDGSLPWTERYAPWVYGGDGRQLDTRTLARGQHTFAVKAYATDGTVTTLTLRVTVA